MVSRPAGLVVFLSNPLSKWNRYVETPSGTFLLLTALEGTFWIVVKMLLSVPETAGIV